MAKKAKRGDKPVSMSDIAKEAGVSLMTVSLAIRDHDRISDATKKRVREAADKLGYEKDPELARLMAYIRDRKQFKLQANIAFIHFSKTNAYTPDTLFGEVVHRAVHEYAARLNYGVEDVSAAIKGMNKRRMSQILKARNIQGLVLGSAPEGIGPEVTNRLPVSDYPGVNVGYSLDEPKYSRVVLNHYQSLRLTMEKLVDLGFKRIGLIMEMASSARTRDLWVAGFTAWQLMRFKEILVPPLILEHDLDERIRQWMEGYHPDVILMQKMFVMERFSLLGYRIPDDLSVAFINANFQKGRPVAGIVQNVEAQGELAVEYLISQILARKQGIPDPSVTMMVKGSWRDGDTLRPPGKSLPVARKTVRAG